MSPTRNEYLQLSSSHRKSELIVASVVRYSTAENAVYRPIEVCEASQVSYKSHICLVNLLQFHSFVQTKLTARRNGLL